MDYLNFWKTNGLKFITPKYLENPEGFDISEVLHKLINEHCHVLEIGCGTGRIAQFLDSEKYIGVDINPSAILKARSRCPKHAFNTTDLDAELPERDTILLYTVCLHIPDESIDAQLKRFSATDAVFIIIAECMNTMPRGHLLRGDNYSIANQRSISEYADLLRKYGFLLDEVIAKPYAYYNGTRDITFAKFQRIMGG